VNAYKSPHRDPRPGKPVEEEMVRVKETLSRLDLINVRDTIGGGGRDPREGKHVEKEIDTKR